MDIRIREAFKDFTNGMSENKAYVMKMEEGKPKIEAKENNLFLIDIRPEAPFKAGHIPGAVSFPLANLVDKVDDIPNDRPIFVVCQTDYSSSYATLILRVLGYQATAILGGVPAWIAAGGKLETS